MTAGKPSREDAAEMYSAALLSNWATQVRCVATKIGVTTPDFTACIGGVHVECEVTNSEQKTHQVILQERSRLLVQQIQAVLPVAGIRVRFSDEAEEVDFRNLIAEAASLTPGAIRESVNRWYIQGFDAPVQPDPAAAVPSWWPKQYAIPAVFHSSAQVSYSSTAHHVSQQSGIEVHWYLSTKSYLNSLRAR